MPNSLDIICLESDAFYALIDEVVARVKQSHDVPNEDKWISDEEAMKLLGITSKTTLQRYRDEGLIRYSQPSRKMIYYDRDSIMAYIDKHAKAPFS